MAEKLRITNHNSRGHKNSKNGYNPKHNDRDFEHEQKHDNIYYSVYSKKGYTDKEKSEFMSFEDVENKYYKDNFYHQYEEQMKRYEKKGNYDRIKTFEEWKETKRYCPEETVSQIGKLENHADLATFGPAYITFMKFQEEWSKQHNNCFQILDFSLHFDESVPHAHSRRVWQYKDSNGKLCIGQDKALEQAGIPLPDPSKPRSSKNNRKIVYDKIMREKWLDICTEYGIDVEREALPNGKHNRSKEQYISDKYENMLKEVESFEQEKADFKKERLKTKLKDKEELKQKKQDLELEYQQKIQTYEATFEARVQKEAIKRAREMFKGVNEQAETASDTRIHKDRNGLEIED